MRLGLIGNPENRRVAMFCGAAQRLGMSVECLSWLEILQHFQQNQSDANIWLKQTLAEFDQVRVEALGENQEVQRRVLEICEADPNLLQRGQIGLMDQYYDGFCQIMRWLAASECDFLNHPNAICLAFDKWKSAQLFADAGLPRPQTELAPQSLTSFHEFRQRFGGSSGRMFLKPRFSSSASGVCAYRWQGQQQQLIAPIEIEHSGGEIRLFNSLKVRSYTRLADIRNILSRLLPLKMIAERWIPKLNLNSRRCDLRIVVINGEARHFVVRKSATPMTNLHLGNERGTLAELEDEVGVAKVAECRELAVAAFSCFDGLTYAGVDIILDSRRRPQVCEINSFGDLLPGVRDRGESTYEATLKSLKTRAKTPHEQVQLEV